MRVVFVVVRLVECRPRIRRSASSAHRARGSLRRPLDEQVKNPRQVFRRGEPDLDCPTLAAEFYIHWRTEPPAELLFGKRDIGGFPGALGVSSSPGPFGLFSESLDLSNREPALNDLDGDGFLSLHRADRQKRSRVSHRELVVFDQLLDLGWKFEQPQGIGDAGSFFPDPASDLLLGYTELLDQTSECVGLLDGVQLLALDVFDQRHLQHVLVSDGLDDAWNLLQAGSLRGPPAPLPGNDLEPLTLSSDHQRLNDPARLYGGRQFIHRFVVERGARLIL